MKTLFTPAWYRKAQKDPTLFKRTFETYDRQLSRVRPKLSMNVRRLSTYSFHDCMVKEVRLLENQTVVLYLRGYCRLRNGGSGVEGLHVIAMKGVRETTLSPECVGGYWLYEELSASGKQLRLSALLTEPTTLISFKFTDAKVTVGKRAK